MYIRGPIPSNFAELDEAVPVATTSDEISRMGFELGVPSILNLRRSLTTATRRVFRCIWSLKAA